LIESEINQNVVFVSARNSFCFAKLFINHPHAIAEGLSIKSAIIVSVALCPNSK